MPVFSNAGSLAEVREACLEKDLTCMLSPAQNWQIKSRPHRSLGSSSTHIFSLLFYFLFFFKKKTTNVFLVLWLLLMKYTLCPKIFLYVCRGNNQVKHFCVNIFFKFPWSFSKACLKSKISNLLSSSSTNLWKATRCPNQRFNSVFHIFVKLGSNWLFFYSGSKTIHGKAI